MHETKKDGLSTMMEQDPHVSINGIAGTVILLAGSTSTYSIDEYNDMFSGKGENDSYLIALIVTQCIIFKCSNIQM